MKEDELLQVGVPFDSVRLHLRLHLWRWTLRAVPDSRILGNKIVGGIFVPLAHPDLR